MLGWPKVLFGFFYNILQKNLNELFGQPSSMVIAVNKFHQGRKQLHHMMDFYQPGPHYTLLFLWCSCSTNVTFCSRRSHQVTWRRRIYVGKWDGAWRKLSIWKIRSRSDDKMEQSLTFAMERTLVLKSEKQGLAAASHTCQPWVVVVV